MPRARIRLGAQVFAAFLLVLALASTATIAARGGATERATGGGDFTPHGTQPGINFPVEPPTFCQTCHGGITASEDLFMPHSSWSGSLMSNATRDPLFWAALDVAERDVPGSGDWCLRCHTPSGWLEGHVRKDGQGGFVNGTKGCLLEGDHDNPDGEENDYSGVTCLLCHRMTPTGPAGAVAPQFGNGNVWLDDNASCDGSFGPCRYGPFSYTADDPLQAPHNAKFSRFTTSSAICGTCHDVSSPEVGGQPLQTLILPNGMNTGRAFPAERTYAEWSQSRFGDTLLIDSFEPEGTPSVASRGNVDCQDCHMRNSTSPEAKACQNNPDGSRVNQLPVHEFVGGGVWPLRLLKSLYGGVLGRDEAFDRTIAWSLELLQQRSATVDVSVDPWAGGASPVTTRVRVTNLAGHKLPTGYSEGRRMWLHVVARDAMGNQVFESGAWSASTGVLASDPQLKVYETLQGEWDGTSCRTTDGMGRKQFHFVRNNCIAKDNRIPPEGFRPATPADPLGLEVRPVAYSYPETSPGSGILVHYDDSTYTFSAPGAVSPISVTATLEYQTSSKEYIEFLRNEAVENAQPTENAMCGRAWEVGPANKSRGQFMYDLWNDPALGKSPPVHTASDSASTP